MSAGWKFGAWETRYGEGVVENRQWEVSVGVARASELQSGKNKKIKRSFLNLTDGMKTPRDRRLGWQERLENGRSVLNEF